MEMQKERSTKDDGRYLIYYTFRHCAEETGKKATPTAAPAPPADPPAAKES